MTTPPSPIASHLARSHGGLGHLQAQTGGIAEAFESYSKALAIQEKLADERRETPAYQVEAATSSINLGIQMALADDPAGGLASCRRAWEFLARIPKPEPVNRYSMARTQALIGAMLDGYPSNRGMALATPRRPTSTRRWL